MVVEIDGWAPPLQMVGICSDQHKFNYLRVSPLFGVRNPKGVSQSLIIDDQFPSLKYRVGYVWAGGIHPHIQIPSQQLPLNVLPIRLSGTLIPIPLFLPTKLDTRIL